jgi:hypothetical protein
MSAVSRNDPELWGTRARLRRVLPERVLAFYFIRVPPEDQLMREDFGEAYTAYAARTGRILPPEQQSQARSTTIEGTLDGSGTDSARLPYRRSRRRLPTSVRRVLIADDKARTRRALSAVLATRGGFKLINPRLTPCGLAR